ILRKTGTLERQSGIADMKFPRSLDLAATRSPGGVSVSGFSLHGNVAIPAGDRLFQIPNRISRFRKDWRNLSALENVLERPLSSDRIKRWKPALDDLCRKTNT